MSDPAKNLKQFRCPFVLEAGHKRAGEVCGRRFQAPHEACQNHRPPPVQAPRKPGAGTPEKVRARRRARASVGVSANWSEA